jgi:hypothetical protein
MNPFTSAPPPQSREQRATHPTQDFTHFTRKKTCAVMCIALTSNIPSAIPPVPPPLD